MISLQGENVQEKCDKFTCVNIFCKNMISSQEYTAIRPGKNFQENYESSQGYITLVNISI